MNSVPLMHYIVWNLMSQTWTHRGSLDVNAPASVRSQFAQWIMSTITPYTEQLFAWDTVGIPKLCVLGNC